LDNQPNNIRPENFVNLPDGDEHNDQSTDQENNLRDVIAQQMWNDFRQNRN
jgi:hypothetical protein